MERPSKRRRLHQRGLRGAHRSFTDFLQEPEAIIALSTEDKSLEIDAPTRYDNQHEASAEEDLISSELPTDKYQEIQPRQIPPAPVSQVAQPVSTAVESVVRVIVDNPAGTPVGDVLVPAQSSVFTFDGYGPLTLASNAASPTSFSLPPPQHESSSPSIASDQPSQPTQQTTPTPTEQPSSRSIEASPASSAASTNSVPSQSPMTISVPGSSSQFILSSPPATPVPSSPSSSTSSTSAIGSTSTTSYFSLSSSASSASSSTHTSSISSLNPTATNPSSPMSTTNSTMTSVTSSETSTGSKGLTSLTFATMSNSTLLTSTRTSSSSGTGTISSTNSQTTSSTISSSSTSSASSPTSSSSSVSTTSGAGIVPGGIGGATGTSNGSTPSSTSGAGAGSGNSSSSTPSTPSVVGGVVGGVAGLTIILLLILAFIRWRRRKVAGGRNISQPMTQSIPPTSGAPSGTVTERSSNVPFAAAGIFKRIRPRSSATAATTETAPSERGFQNFGGRKIQSVLEHGGDGFGNPDPYGSGGPSRPTPGFGAAPVAAGLRPASPQTPLSETSFYRDSQGFYGGAPEPEPSSNPSSMYGRPESPPPRSPDRFGPALGSTSPLARAGSQARRDEEVAFMRPGPARTPVTNQPGVIPSLRPPPATGRGTPPPRPLPGPGASPVPRDGVGRSHPSFDGSRGSRFTEEITPP